MMRVGSLSAAAFALFCSLATAEEAAGPKLVLPLPDAERGRFLFASKGCVVCHSINGVGGKAGPALDADSDNEEIDPLGFAARMWRGAVAMSILQSSEFGYQIEMSGDEIADLAAFVANPSLQSTFSLNDVPEVMREWTIDEPFSADGLEWPEARPGEDLTGSALGEPGDPEHGRLLAQRFCTECHVVAADEEGGDAGPAFASIASRPGMNDGAIHDWLTEPHANMPEFMNLGEAEFNDIASYIMSLAP